MMQNRMALPVLGKCTGAVDTKTHKKEQTQRHTQRLTCSESPGSKRAVMEASASASTVATATLSFSCKPANITVWVSLRSSISRTIPASSLETVE